MKTISIRVSTLLAGSACLSLCANSHPTMRRPKSPRAKTVLPGAQKPLRILNGEFHAISALSLWIQFASVADLRRMIGPQTVARHA
jgi:hypothetical protein